MFSVWFGNPCVQRLGNGHALHDGHKLFKRCHIRASYTTWTVYVSTNAFSFYKFTGKTIIIILITIIYLAINYHNINIQL